MNKWKRRYWCVQPSSGVYQYSFHSDFIAPVDQCRHGNRYHGNAATQVAGCDRGRRECARLLDAPVLCFDETQCKQISDS